MTLRQRQLLQPRLHLNNLLQFQKLVTYIFRFHKVNIHWSLAFALIQHSLLFRTEILEALWKEFHQELLAHVPARSTTLRGK